LNIKKLSEYLNILPAIFSVLAVEMVLLGNTVTDFGKVGPKLTNFFKDLHNWDNFEDIGVWFLHSPFCRAEGLCQHAAFKGRGGLGAVIG
jgi:hypothetical protein